MEISDSEALEKLLGDPPRQAEARSRLRALVDGARKTLTYRHWEERLPVAHVRQPVVIVSSFTIETLAPFLEVEAYLSGWRPAVRYVQYGQWQNAMLDPGALGGEPPRAVVLLVHDVELFPMSSSDTAAVTDRLGTLIATFRERTPTPLFVGIASTSPTRHAIAYGESWGRGHAAMLSAIRGAVTELAATTPDVHLLDLDAASLGTADWHNPTDFFTTRSVYAHRALPGLARILARNIACLFRARRKVLVVDLDNVMWGGIVGEDGIDGIELGTEWPGSAFLAFQHSLRALRETGILLAINSKNNEADAREAFERRPEMVLRWDDFSAIRVNWNDKASNLLEIAEELGLGLDSFVFADDSALECALVRSSLPEVEVVELGNDPSRFTELLLQTQAFDTLGVSDEDRTRARSYAAEAGRKRLRKRVTDLQSFLACSDLRLGIRSIERKAIDRVHQLLGKTNQFNFTLERLSKESIHSMAERADHLYSASLSDQFGDYGLIGVLHVELQSDEARIANMVLSCRALGRGVEDALLALAREIAVGAGRRRLRVGYLRGPRNQQVADYLRRVGFSAVDLDDSRVDYTIELTDDVLPWPSYVKVDVTQKETRAS